MVTALLFKTGKISQNKVNSLAQYLMPIHTSNFVKKGFLLQYAQYEYKCSIQI